MSASASADGGALGGRHVVLVVGGGIAAYKSAVLARELLRAGATVDTVLTGAAQRFVGAVTFAGITGRAPYLDLWDTRFPGELHVELASRAGAIVVAPATADLLARMAHGLADDLATTLLLCCNAPLLVAPAMHPRMWNHAATQASVALLAQRGVHFAGPVVGALASGETGIGRMTEPEVIAHEMAGLFQADLRGVRVLVTAGPTHEPIDPVRFVGNRSSGRMGCAVAERARARGATVTLIHGPMSAEVPHGVSALAVRDARAMHDAVMAQSRASDVVVMSAAVADYRPETVATDKIKKGESEVVLRMVRNPDILAELGSIRGDAVRPVLVGFAVETRELVAAARAKLARKGCDLVVANLARDGFEGDDNVVVLVDRDGETELPRMGKRDVADRLLDRVVALLAK